MYLSELGATDTPTLAQWCLLAQSNQAPTPASIDGTLARATTTTIALSTGSLTLTSTALAAATLATCL